MKQILLYFGKLKVIVNFSYMSPCLFLLLSLSLYCQRNSTKIYSAQELGDASLKAVLMCAVNRGMETCYMWEIATRHTLLLLLYLVFTLKITFALLFMILSAQNDRNVSEVWTVLSDWPQGKSCPWSSSERLDFNFRISCCLCELCLNLPPASAAKSAFHHWD